jgi:2,4-dienoyl-CoA reductase (NADPH2)
VTHEGVIVTRRGTDQFIKADTVVLALGARPNIEVFENVKDKCSEVHLAGDALKPRRILEAIHEGFEIARTI